MQKESAWFAAHNVPIQVTPRDLTVVLADGTELPVRYYASPTPLCLVLLDAPNQNETEREEVAVYISAFGAAQVYRLRDQVARDMDTNRARGFALLDALVAREPDAPIILGTFSTETGLAPSFPQGYFGARGGLPPQSPIQMRDGARLLLREYAADAETVMLVLHGSTTHDVSYAPLARFLAARKLARVFTLTLRGHGLSDGARGDVSYIAQCADDVADTLAYLRTTTHAEKIILLGHSLGAGLTLRFCESRYAETVDGYILLAPYVGTRTPLQDRKTHVIAAQPHWRNAILLTFVNAVGVTRWNHLPVLDFEILPGFQTPMEVARYSYRGWTAFSPTRRFDRALTKLQKPMLVVLSEGDELFVAHKLQSLFANAPRVKCVTIREPTHSGIAFHPQAFEQTEAWLVREQA